MALFMKDCGRGSDRLTSIPTAILVVRERMVTSLRSHGTSHPLQYCGIHILSRSQFRDVHPECMRKSKGMKRTPARWLSVGGI